MNIKQLEYVIAVAEHGSVNAAAKVLNLSQPAVSVSVRKLEDELGFTLFVRDNRGMTPSASGRIFLGHARNFLNNISTIKNQNKQAESIINVIANPVLSSFLTNHIFVNYMNEHKDVFISTFSDTPYNALKLIRKHKISIAVVCYGAEVNLDSSLKHYKFDTRHLGSDRRKLFLSSKSRYAHKDVLTLDDLANINVFFYMHGKDEVADYYCSLIRFANVFRIGSREDILNLVQHDEGGFLQPGFLFHCDERVRQGLIVGKDIDVPGIDNDVNIYATLCEKSPAPHVLELYNCILDNFASHAQLMRDNAE